ncbi:MAB_1171c family putative transporter [Streptomyces sp. NPDC088554]|uniref:MAB_1171c family putative transporter n=1 Tax=Streptomyces sp. NPDC088554 TaxID=3365865 RepID=UPI0038077C84
MSEIAGPVSALAPIPVPSLISPLPLISPVPPIRLSAASAISETPFVSETPLISAAAPLISETPFNVIYLTIGTVAWIAAALKIRAWLRDPSPGLLVVALTVAAPATAFVVAAPVLYRLIDRAAHRGNLATLLVYLGITGFSAGAVALARIWTPSGERSEARIGDRATAEIWRQVRHRLWTFAALVTAMVVLFLTGGAHSPETPTTFDTTFATVPRIAAFLVIYQAVFGFALVDIGRVCLGHASRLPAGRLRQGIRLIAIGGFVACGYVVCKLIAIAAAGSGVGGAEWLSTALAPAFAALGAVLITAGFAGPAVAAWTRRRRDYQALRPLWDLVYGADRRLALEEPPSPWNERLAFRDLEWRTARRGLEIRDGQLTLRPWVDPAVVPAAALAADRAGLDASDRAALTVAVALRSAVEELRAGAPPRAREDQAPLPGLDTEPAEEREHLVRIARRLYAPLTDETLAGGGAAGSTSPTGSTGGADAGPVDSTGGTGATGGADAGPVDSTGGTGATGGADAGPVV